MRTAFELFLLDNRHSTAVVALGRRGADTAIEHLPIGPSLAKLGEVGARIGQSLAGNGNWLTSDEVKSFGNDLFNFLFQGELRALYDRLPKGAISMQILSDRPEIKDVPWEYLRTPNCQPVPHRERSVIRVQPTCGIDSPEPRKLKKVRVLFVSANPVDQTDIPWSEFQEAVERALSSQMPADVSVKVVEGATQESLVKAIQANTFEVFHYFGHGGVQNGEGNLILQDARTKKSALYSATKLAIALSGKGVRLAILSACQTGAGERTDDFSIVATALIRAGIPAVVANQYPIPIKSISPFVGSVYASLLMNGNIDTAVAEGRAMLAAGIPGAMSGNVEWGIPVLYRFADSQQIFVKQT